VTYIFLELVRHREVHVQTKLTLRIEEELIERVKSYSQKSGKSVSQLFADYIKMLPESGGRQSKPQTTPLVRSLRGLLRGAQIDEEDYRRHLAEKHR
jgi:hypothetical protein